METVAKMKMVAAKTSTVLYWFTIYNIKTQR